MSQCIKSVSQSIKKAQKISKKVLQYTFKHCIITTVDNPKHFFQGDVLINKKALFEVISYNHFSIKEMAYILNLEEKEFRKKLELGIFQSNEIEMMLHFLEFPVNPMLVFFDTYDYENPKKIDWSRAIVKEK